MTKTASPSIFNIRLIARLASQRIIFVSPAVHRLMAMVAIEMGLFQRRRLEDSTFWYR